MKKTSDITKRFGDRLVGLIVMKPFHGGAIKDYISNESLENFFKYQTLI